MLFLFKNTANEQIEIFSILFSIIIRSNCSIFIKYLFHVKTKSMLNSPKNFVSKIIVPAIFVTIVTFPSCKKDKTSATSGIEGSYKFKNISAKTQSSIAGNLGDKIVTIADYITTNNGGTVTFANNALTASGLTYTVNTQAEYYEYYNNSLLDSASYPFTFTLPPSNSTGQYELVGADSIYFPKGGITVASDGSASYQGQPSGGHYSISGNVLTISQSVSKDSSFTDSGESYILHESASGSMEFEKQ